MMTKFVKTALIATAQAIAVMTLSLSPAHAVTASSDTLQCGSSIYGAWVTDEGNSVVNIYNCDATNICGEIVKFSDNAKYDELTPETAKPLSDVKGPRVLNAFRAKSENKFKGRIFNPRNGKSYKSTLKVSDMGDLKVKGCLGPLCQTKIWMRPKTCS